MEENEQQPQKGSMLGKLLIAGVMGGVILGECVLAYVWIPSAEEVAAAQMPAEDETTDEEGEEKEDAENEEVLVKEVELGHYGVTVHQGGGNSLRVDFKLGATVLEEEMPEFEPLYDRNKNRFREKVIFEIRNSELTDLTDPGLGLIKRRILEKSNALLGKSILKTVVFSDFTYVEQ